MGAPVQRRKELLQPSIVEKTTYCLRHRRQFVLGKFAVIWVLIGCFFFLTKNFITNLNSSCLFENQISDAFSVRLMSDSTFSISPDNSIKPQLMHIREVMFMLPGANCRNFVAFGRKDIVPDD